MLQIPKLMYDNVLPTSLGSALYTAPTKPGYAIVEEIIIHNYSATATPLNNMQIGNTQIWQQRPLQAGETIIFQGKHIMDAGTILTGQAATENTLQCSISGVEVIA